MGQKLSEIIKDLLSRKNPDGSRQWTQMTLAAKLGTNQSGISQMLTGRQWDDHFEVFRKLVVDVEPLALFGEPLDADAMWHYLYLLVHTKVPHEIRSPAWGRIREKIGYRTGSSANYPRGLWGVTMKIVLGAALLAATCLVYTNAEGQSKEKPEAAPPFLLIYPNVPLSARPMDKLQSSLHRRIPTT
jgi:hypothetical protein